VILLPVWLSLKIALLATAVTIATGLPVAWLLGRRVFPGRGLLETVVLLPLVLPPTVLGYYLIVLFGRATPLGDALQHIGLALEFTWLGAAIAAWIGAFGLFVRAAQPGFELIDRGLEDAARTLGRSEWSLFWSVTLPLAWRPVLTGAVLAFCRAMGDIGLTLLAIGYLPGRTAAMPPALSVQLQSAMGAANLFLLLTVVFVASLLLAVGHFTRVRN
jgi:molybdate transport system permease protein